MTHWAKAMQIGNIDGTLSNEWCMIITTPDGKQLFTADHKHESDDACYKCSQCDRFIMNVMGITTHKFAQRKAAAL